MLGSYEIKLDRTDKMKTEAPQSTMSGASPEDTQGKHPNSSSALRKVVITPPDFDSCRGKSREMVILGDVLKTFDNRAMWLL